MRTYPFAALVVAVFVLLSGEASADQAEPIQTRPRDAYVGAMHDLADGYEAATEIAAARSQTMVCPVPGSEFTDSFGAPRDGHTHQGVDMMAPGYTPVLAPEAGTYEQHGYESFYLHGDSGTLYFGTHLFGHIAPDGRVEAGQPVAYVGNTGNASGGATHLHFEIHPDGGAAVDPYGPTLSACDGPATETAALTAVGCATDRIDAAWVACKHRQEGHSQWRHGLGTPGHTWERYRQQARVVRAFLLAVYLHRVAAAQATDLVWHWQPVADCESGDNINAVSPSGYMGWLQFDQSSWTANGGSGSPLGQPREVAARVAENYRLRSGLSPWPVCGQHYR